MKLLYRPTSDLSSLHKTGVTRYTSNHDEDDEDSNDVSRNCNLE